MAKNILVILFLALILLNIFLIYKLLFFPKNFPKKVSCQTFVKKSQILNCGKIKTSVIKLKDEGYTLVKHFFIGKVAKAYQERERITLVLRFNEEKEGGVVQSFVYLPIDGLYLLEEKSTREAFVDYDKKINFLPPQDFLKKIEKEKEIIFSVDTILINDQKKYERSMEKIDKKRKEYVKKYSKCQKANQYFLEKNGFLLLKEKVLNNCLPIITQISYYE